MHPSRTRSVLTALTGLLAVLASGLVIVAATPAHAANTDIKINEVESNGDTRDWIELTNTGSATVNVGGWILKDNDDSRTLAIAAGTSIAPGGYAAFDVDNPATPGSFGLGGADSARVYLPDGTTLIDSYSWTAHAAITYGRCPNGTGAFVNTLATTKGAANACATPNTAVKINEVESSGGTPGDWIELTNTGSGPVSIGGWILKDNDNTHSFAIPAGTTLAAGAYQAFDVEASFGLGGADSARLFLADGTTQIDSYDWTTHATTTYGRCPNGTGAFVTTLSSTKGAANACPGAPTTVKINEFSSNNPDFVELINTGSSSVDLSGWVLKDNTDNNSYTFPAGSSIAAGARKLLNGEGTDFVFGLGNGDSVRLYWSGDLSTPVDSFTYPAHPPAGKSYSRCPEGTGDFVTTGAATPGTANDCAVAPVIPDVKINEVESNGDPVADWVELKNNGSTPADISGWKILDNDPAHVATPVVVPAGTVIPAGGYYAIYTEIGQTPGFGLGGADSATLLLPDGTTQVDTYSWTSHASTTYGRCPDGTGPFVTTTTPTRGLANACTSLRLNEIEPNGGSGGDWIELKNISSSFVSISGWKLQDVASNTTYTIPDLGIPGGTYILTDQTAFGFDMAASDTLRLLDDTGAVVESYSWTAQPATSFGRCKDGVGDFTTTKAITRGSANSCPGLDTQPWPGPQTVSTADNTDTFVQDLSGLAFDPSNPDVLWAAQNKKGTLFKLVRDAGDNWVPAPTWPRDPTFAGGTGAPDTEGITVAPDGFVYMTSERDNSNSGISRNTILRFDPNSPAGATIVPTTEWDLNSLIPATGANLGLEGITYVPDSYLIANGFKDQSTGATYTPSTYPNHGSGLFFVAVEATGNLVGFALGSDGTAHKVATVDSGFTALADVDFDPELGRLRAVTDDTFDGKTSLLKIDGSGSFVVDVAYDRPAGMPNLNNEGLAVAPQSRCVNGLKEVLWSDDGDTDGHSIRRGAITCTVPDQPQVVAITSIPPTAPVVGQTYDVTTTGGGSGNPVVLSLGVLSAGHCSLTGSTVHFDHPGACTIKATQAAAPGYLAGEASQELVINKATQTITFAQPGDTVYGGASVPLSATSDAGLPVTFVSQTPGVCSIDGTSAKPLAAGTCTVSAVQGGNDDVLAADPVQRTLTVAKAPVVVTTRSTSGLASLLTLRITYTSTVKSAVTGLPVAGVPVTTRINGGSPTSGCTATTNASGVATCTVGPISIALGVTYTATAAATSNHLGGSGSAFIGLF